MGKFKIITSIFGLVNWWDDTSVTPLGAGVPPRVALDAGASFGVFAQTSNTSKGDAGNQAIGTVLIPAGTPNGAAISLTNALLTPASYVFLQVKDSAGKVVALDTVITAAGSATFRVHTEDKRATTKACDAWYFIVN